MLTPDEIIATLTEHYNYRLNQEEDLKIFLQVIYDNNEDEALERICFDAKFAAGVIKIIRRQDESITEEAMVKLQTEYTKAVKRVHAEISTLGKGLAEFHKKIFKSKYFDLTREAIANLNYIIEDFGAVKTLLNEKKEG